MEGDNNNSPPRTNRFVEDCIQRSLEMFEFIVDRNPQRLDNASRRILPATRLTRNAGGADGFELLGGLNGIASSLLTNSVGNLPSELFFAVRFEDRCKFVAGCRLQQLAGWLSAGRIESQIQRTSGFETKPTRSVFELIAGQTEIDEHTVHGVDTKCVQFLAEMDIAGMDKSNRTKVLQPFPREVQHHRVAIETQQSSVRFDKGTNRRRMAAGSDGSVNNSQFRCEIKELNNFAQQHRLVNRPGRTRRAAFSHGIDEQNARKPARNGKEEMRGVSCKQNPACGERGDFPPAMHPQEAGARS